MKIASSTDIRQVAAAAAEVALDDAGAPARRVKLLPIGEVPLRGPPHGGAGPFRVRDRAHADQIVAATRRWLGSADFSWDYDHQMAFAVNPGVGGTAPAAGWTRADQLEVADDGIYASVDWTADADAHLRARRYRYLSPLFLAAKNGDVVQLKNAALVNIGAIDLPAIAAGHSGEDDDMTKLALIAVAAGLASSATATEAVNATEADIISAIDALRLKASATGSTSAIAIAAGLAADATAEEIAAGVATLKAGEPDPAKYVPIDQVKGMTAQLGVLSADRAEREVAAAISTGKLAPAMKAWGLKLFKSSEADWADYVKDAPVIVAAGAALDERKPGEPVTSLTAVEIAACAAIGISQDDFLKARNAEIAAAGGQQ